MGRNGAPLYGGDYATAIETAEKLLAKIKSGKATEANRKEFLEVCEEIVKYEA